MEDTPNESWSSKACDPFVSKMKKGDSVPPFNEDLMHAELEACYKLHEDPFLIGRVNEMKPWKFFRRPHKPIVDKLVRLMLVCDDVYTTLRFQYF